MIFVLPSADYACPLQAKAIPASRIASKLMPDILARLGGYLDLRFLSARRCEPPAVPTEPEKKGTLFWLKSIEIQTIQVHRAREDVYSNWLSAKFAQRGARLSKPAKLKSFRRVPMMRRLATRPTEGPDALMQGIIEVTDSGMCSLTLLARGVGRHRAYGYGMLLHSPGGYMNPTHVEPCRV